YMIDFFEPISALAQRYTILQSALAGAERVFGLLDTEEADATTTAEGQDGDAAAALEFSHVQFSYKSGVTVLQDVSFSAAPGEKVALVGPTGSGKTTIASLLLRLYDVDSGSVRVFGRDVRNLDRTTLRSSFAVVPQDVFLFPGTIADNIATGQVP